MKHLLLAVALLSTPAYAGGPVPTYEEPEVIAPARSGWSGPFVGLAYSRMTSSEETVECFKLGNQRACDDPIQHVYPELWEEVRTTAESSDDLLGLRLGYRFSLGKVVPGVELGIYEEKVIPGASLGVDFGQLLPYMYYDKQGAALGFEATVSERLSAGVRHGEGGTALTVSWGF